MSLHSTLVILRCTFDHMRDWNLVLYIPLWLYYDTSRSRCSVLRFRTLHSTLVILRLFRTSSLESPGALYIPLWLYYDRERNRIDRIIIRLYIPLWLYYDKDGKKFYIVKLSLHSTLVILRSRTPTTNAAARTSTFHSGYITIHKSTNPAYHRQTLHSTLVILRSYS